MVERITQIMDVFALPMATLSLDEVTRRSGLPRSTTHRILTKLVQFGWVSYIDAQYSLGQRALGLGARELVYNQLRSAAHSRLHDLSCQTGLTVHLAALDGPNIYYVDKFGGQGSVRVPSEVGGRAPAHCTALGKAILAQLPPEAVHEQYADVLGSARHTNRTIVTMSALHRELARIRGRHGLAFERGECFSDIACVGMPVSDSRGPVAAVSVVADFRSNIERFAPLVVEVAHAVSRDLIQKESVSTGQPAPNASRVSRWESSWLLGDGSQVSSA
ncbi:IclR family transcriptional regulator [Kineosporia mesophila]|uniref:IclR family transcriptional regulator n=1 Tax=Kineosporia mesophila TaxID=566012 RepID=A0ABP6ZS50_9ACTN|nr:IclR family transcriptional regulator [Kineosporia mesophila]MCD5354468.1 IclR family transcriptional regulator [Kineosporia mesophila]